MKKRILLCGLLLCMPLFIQTSVPKQKEITVIPEAPKAPEVTDYIATTTPYRIQTTEVKQKDERKGEKRKTPMHDVIILINTGLSESKREPITAEFALAICEQSIPIIATNNVLKNLFELAKKNEYDGAVNKIVDSFKKSFDDWFVYKTESSDLYVLIPKKYLTRKRAEIDVDGLEKAIKSKGYKLDNVLRGFDIWHLTEIKKFEDVEPTAWLQQSELNVENLKSLFVAKKDDVFGAWNIYLTGHGTISKAINEILFSVSSSQQTKESTLSASSLYQTKTLKESSFEDVSLAGMNLNQFRSLLQFFNDKISTNFLFYSTCEAGGSNRILPFIVNLMNSQGAVTGTKKPNFVVGIGAISDTSTSFSFAAWKWCVSCLDKKESEECDPGNNSMDHKRFFELLHEYSKNEGTRPTIFNDQELQKILISVSPRNTASYDPWAIAGLPQIMFPGSDIFTAINIYGNVGIITNVIAKQQTLDKKPIIIGKDKEAILLYPDTITGELNIKSEKPVSIISMIPFATFHRIENLVVNTSIDQFIESSIKNPYASKRYFYSINTLKTSSGEFHNVIIAVDDDKLLALYYVDKQVKMKTWPKNEKFDYELAYSIPLLKVFSDALLDYCILHGIDYKSFDTFFKFHDDLKSYIMYSFLNSTKSKEFFKEDFDKAKKELSLSAAVMNENTTLLSSLMFFGGNIKDENGNTALMLAIANKKKSVIKFLIDRKDSSNWYLGNKDQKTALDIAKEMKDKETVELFKKYCETMEHEKWSEEYENCF